MADNPTSPAAGSHESGGEQSPRSGVREQDRYLPIANISRIMKKALPANGKIAKDAKDTVQECVSEFISFVTSEASDKKKQFGKEDCWKVFKDRIVIMETLIGPPVVQLKLSALKIEGDRLTDRSNARSWWLCTVEEVEDFNTLIKILPLWSTGIVLTMDRRQ